MVLWTAATNRLSDEALLAAIAVGEADACAVFVRRFQRQVYGLAVTMLGDRAGAEDVPQQTFERAWRHAGAYDARRASVRTWLLTICRRLAIDALRLRRATPLPPEELLRMLPAATGERPEDRAIDVTEVERVRRAVAGLPEEQRRALLLAVLGGHTASEIAGIEQVPLGTVKSRIRLGMGRLRAQLVPDGEGLISDGAEAGDDG
ncbi:MAG TPA: sigma-70 family RNA polymerase sigma factor [Microthrixaceae bacterium]|nr:sigma-70 family RNA polymerase sigma factor [Microthrixaceae bacterium]